MRSTQEHCRLCYKVIAPFDPDRDESGKYHVSCMKRTERHRLQVMYVMSFFLLVFVGCASAPVSTAKRWMHGCTPSLNRTTGELNYAEVLVVGETPDGNDFWVYYPGRLKQRKVEGKVPAERLSMAIFIENGAMKKVFGRPCKCPSRQWGVTSGVSAAD